VPYYGYGDYYPYGYSFGPGYWPDETAPYTGPDDGEGPLADGGKAWQPDPPEPKAGANRGTSARAKETAWKYIGYGDALFGKQKYAQANDRYRTAARSASQLGAPLFRQGLALAATGRCDLAAAALKKGLKLDPTWPKSDFTLEQVVGPDKGAKKALLDALAAAVEAKPADADRMFVLGVFLHFDGQLDRAATFFERAEKIAGDNVGHIEAFLEPE
jgi:tetratricopeptide (TPR) repeat protein